MSNVVEDRIINLQFNNKEFEKNAAQSMKTIDALEEKLTFKKVAGKGVDVFKGFIDSAKQVPSVLESIADKGSLGIISNIKNAFTKNGDLFSPLLEMATGAFRQIGQEAYQLGKEVTTSLTTQQIDAGWQKYEDKTKSVQTIMNATGKSIEEVTEALSKLNWYSDETSYSYTDMTSNIAKFTSSGVKLDTAVTAMIGIGNAAGLAGASVQNASHAMSGFAKAIGQGYMDRQKWSWIETAQMDTQQFKKSLIEAAVALGELHSNGDGTYYSNKGKELTSLESFENDMAKGRWMTAEVMLRALNDYGSLTNKVYDIYQSYRGEKTTSEILDEMGVSAENLGLKSLKASQEAKTFSDAIESVKDAVSTGWMTTFDTIFGNYVEAKKLWTDFANWLYDMFAESGNYRNGQFDIFMGRTTIEEDGKEYFKIGKDMVSGREYMLQALYKFMEVISAYAEAIKDAWDKVIGTWDYNTIAEIAKKIHRVAELLGATLERVDPNSLTNKWEKFDNMNRNGFIKKFRDSMESIFEILKETVETLKTMGKTFYETLYEAFGDKNDLSHGFYFSGFYKWFKDITSRVVAFIKTFRKVLVENDRFRRILNGNFSILKIFFNIIRDAADYIIQNGGGIVAIIAEFLASLGDMAVSLNRSNLYDFIQKLFPLINNLTTKILNGILKIISFLGKLKDFAIDFFEGIDNKVGKTGALDKLAAGLQHFGDSLGGLFGLDKLGEFIGGLNQDTNRLTFLETIVDMADKAIAALGGFFNFLGSGIDQVKAFGHTLAGIADNAANSIDKIFNTLFGSGEASTGSVAGGVPTDKKTTIFDTLREKASGMLTNLFGDVDNEKVTVGATEYTGSVLSGIIEGIRNAINKLDAQGIDWSKIKAVGYFAAFIVTLININKNLMSANDLVKNFTSIPEAIAKAIENFGGTFTAIKDFLNEAKESLEDLVAIERLEVIAKVVSTMALIVMLLSEIPEQNLAKGVTYLGIICAIFVAFNKAMNAANALINYSYAKNAINVTKSVASGNVFNFRSGPLGWAAVIISLASFVSSIVTAINTMTTASPEDVLKASGLILGIIATMGVMLFALGKLGALFTTSAYSRSEQTLANGTHSEKENKLSGTSGKFFYGIAAAILALSVGIRLITESIKVLADLFEHGDATAVISATAVVLGLIGAVFLSVFGLLSWATKTLNDPSIKEEALKNVGKTMVLMAASIAIIAASIIALVPAIVLLTVTFALVKDPASVGLAMGTVAVLLVVMLGFVLLLMKTLKDLTPDRIRAVGKTMVLIGASMAIFAGAIAIIMGTMAGFIAALTVGNGVLQVMNREELIIIAMTAMGIIILAMMTFMLLLVSQFTNIDNTKIKNIGKTVVEISTALVIISAAMFVMCAGIALIAKSGASWEHSIGVAIAIFVMMFGFLTTIYLTNKLGVKPKDIITLAKSFMYIAGAVVLIAAAVAVLALLDLEAANKAFFGMGAILVVLVVAVAALALLAKYVPGTEIVIAAFAQMMTAMAIIIAAIAASILSFAIATAVVTKCIEPLTAALPAFGTALATFLDSIKGREGQLLILAVAMAAFAVIVASVIVGIIYIVYTFRHQIGTVLTSMFEGIKNLFKSIGTWFKGLPKKTQALITAFALAISSGLVAATPEMYADIEAGFMLLMERLGDSVGWITKGLLALVINIINSLADAIRDNADILAYALYNAFNAVGEVLINLLAPLIAGIFGPIMTYWAYGAEIIGYASSLMTGFATAEDYAHFNDFMSKDFSEHMKDMTESITDTLKEQKELREAGMSALSEWYGVDPAKKAEILSKEAHDEAMKQIDDAKKDAKNQVKDTASTLADGAIEGTEEARGKLMSFFNGNGFSLQGAIEKAKKGLSLDELQNMFTGDNGLIDTSMLGEFGNILNGEGIDTANYEQLAAQLTSTSGSVNGLSTDVANLDANVAGYNGTLSETEATQEDFENSIDSLGEAVKVKETTFYEAGSDLADAVERGFNYNWSEIASNIRGKFKQLADDIRAMLEMKDLNIQVSVNSVTPVYDADTSGIVPRDTQPYNYTWDRDAGMNAMQGDKRYTDTGNVPRTYDRATGSAFANDPRYYNKSAFTNDPRYYNSSYAANADAYAQFLASDVAANVAETNKYSRDQFNSMTEMNKHLKDLNDKFQTTNETLSSIDSKETSVNIDGEKIFSSEWITAKAVEHYNKTQRSGG